MFAPRAPPGRTELDIEGRTVKLERKGERREALRAPAIHLSSGDFSDAEIRVRMEEDRSYRWLSTRVLHPDEGR